MLNEHVMILSYFPTFQGFKLVCPLWEGLMLNMIMIASLLQKKILQLKVMPYTGLNEVF